MKTSDLFTILENKVNNLTIDSSISSVIQFELTGNDGATWCGRISEGKATLSIEAVENPDVVVTTSSETAIALYEKRMKPLIAFMLGKVKVKGDMKHIGILKDMALNAKK